jgi:hypothetical protein
MMRRSKSGSKEAVPMGFIIGRTDFAQYLRCETDESRPCMQSDSPCQYTCQCTVINRAWVTDTHEIDPSLLELRRKDEGSKNLSMIMLSEIDHYCLQRLMVMHGCYSADGYDIKIGGGYYGEEISEINLKAHDELEKDICALLALPTDIAKVMHVLNLEYGYIADWVKEANDVEILVMPLRSAIAASTPMIKRENSYRYPLYSKRPVGVFANGMLLDGQYRLATLLSEKGAQHNAPFVHLRKI